MKYRIANTLCAIGLVASGTGLWWFSPSMMLVVFGSLAVVFGVILYRKQQGVKP